MQVTSYGLFWRRSEIEWSPGSGQKNVFRLLGRVGVNRPSVKVADFRRQQGIYILYDEYGPSYVGLTREQGLGKRLKDHTFDNLRERWDRFSWFGFMPLAEADPKTGILILSAPQGDVSEDTHATIGDLEALLIRAIGPKYNTKQMRFKDAKRWLQIGDEEIETYLGRVSR